MGVRVTLKGRRIDPTSGVWCGSTFEHSTLRVIADAMDAQDERDRESTRVAIKRAEIEANRKRKIATAHRERVLTLTTECGVRLGQAEALARLEADWARAYLDWVDARDALEELDELVNDGTSVDGVAFDNARHLMDTRDRVQVELYDRVVATRTRLGVATIAHRGSR